jgi:hypothetical protein
MSYVEINAFGTVCLKGQGVRVSFDRNLVRVASEKGAAFVLEFSLTEAGAVILRQAGASKEEGLVLTAFARGDKVDIKIGQLIELSNLLRFQHGEIVHPQGSAKLYFTHKGYGGKGTVFGLKWEAGPARATPAAVNPVQGGTEFYRGSGFAKIVAAAEKIQMANGLWYPVFKTNDEALAFARYVGGFVRRVAKDSVTRSRPFWSDERSGYVAKLSIQFPGWGEEEGVVLCSGEEVAGIYLHPRTGCTLLPIKQYTHTMRTENGSLYVLFKDGTVFYRSVSGSCRSADRLFFARSHSEASAAHDNGGLVDVTDVPKRGFSPVYVVGTPTLQGTLLKLPAKSFGYGSPIDSIIPAAS